MPLEEGHVFGFSVRVKADRAGTTLENLQEVMDHQIVEFSELYASLTDAELAEQIDSFGPGNATRAATFFKRVTCILPPTVEKKGGRKMTRKERIKRIADTLCAATCEGCQGCQS